MGNPTGRSLGRRLSDLAFAPETPARLLVVQTGFVLCMGVRIAFSPFPDLTPQPPGLFRPVPFLRGLDRMPSETVIVAVQVLGVAAAIAWLMLARSRRWRANGRRVAFVVMWLCLLFLAGCRASRGKILHNDLLAIWGALPLLFAPGDATYADRTPSSRTGWPVRTSIVIVALTYFFTGWWKLKNTGFDWVFSDNMRWALYGAAKPAWPDLPTYIANRAWLSQLTAGSILLFECTFPLVIFSRRIRPLFIAAAWLFHGGTYLILGLDYWSYAFIVTLLLVDWPPILDRVRGWFVRRRPDRSDRAAPAPSPPPPTPARAG